MSGAIIIGCSVAYVGLLFVIAFWAERRAKAGRSLVNNPYIYALSLAVYCTAWTYYGSVGRAATSGVGFLPIYLGPTILAPLWLLFLRKLILISKSQRITSVADLISSRYGKSTWLGLLGTVIAVFGIIPYISIQLKAIAISFDILTLGGQPGDHLQVPFYADTALYIAIALAIFTILFGTRHLDPNERHEGLVAAIAFESLLKLAAFLAVGIFVVFGLYQGLPDLFTQALQEERIQRLLDLRAAPIDGWSWFWLNLLSMSAVLFLPRQFHVAVVENTSADHVGKASWLFPLYLLLINLFVLPIAFAGLLQFPGASVDPDTFVLALPLHSGQELLALLAALGGFSAATSMVIVAVIALSIMLSNNLVLPLLVKSQTIQERYVLDLPQRLLGIRRISIVVVLLVSYAYFKSVGQAYTLVSIGLISFTAVAQFAPAIVGGVYWKRGTKIGALAGLLVGFVIWAFTLPLPTLCETGILDQSLIEQGLWGLPWLKPYSLFGLEGVDHVSHSAFWSLLFNVAAYVGVSLYTRPNALEITQADLFVDIYKYREGGTDYDVMRRQAKVADVTLLLNRFLGPVRARQVLQTYSKQTGKELERLPVADAELVNFAETHLSGAIGAASAKIIMASVAKDDPIGLEEMFDILEQTREIMQYSKALELKSEELQATTRQLQTANEQLKALDRLKADFITTVTHELRTPITSIKALARILQDTADLPEEKRAEFLGIIVGESERIARLINQVLDLEKIRSADDGFRKEVILLQPLLRKAYAGMSQLMEEKQIRQSLELTSTPLSVKGDPDKLTQVVINLLSNAVKFSPPGDGLIALRLKKRGAEALIEVADNGIGIAAEDQELIFGQFTQLSDRERGKPTGSGLGLYISRQIVERHGGRLQVDSKPGEGAVFQLFLPLVKK
ncbi:MAG: hypothetical protein KDC32_05875 [Saprospiraceae bacterium]|nr:hypothetical protein [Saprospiraceae bacterium]MCB0676967.1 hypothetical protein [Saprospiraceae bacterium]MCB0680462.1 hypothetical protein [Saprospiraceae bacterium]